MRLFPLLLVLVVHVAAAVDNPQAAPDVPHIAAAADLQFALPELAAAFTRATGASVALTFGSSGNFRRQIAEGAPFEMFLSADQSYVQALAREGRTRDDGTLYAVGRIAIVAPPGSPLTPDAQLDGLRDALAAGRIIHFAIANPEHAPYGRAAEQALTHKGLWKALQPRLVLGENVSQAAQFALSGNAQGGIIAYSQVVAPAFGKGARYALIPAAWHAPLNQRMVLMKGAGTTATAFYRYLQSPPARAILARYGFTLPAHQGRNGP